MASGARDIVRTIHSDQLRTLAQGALEAGFDGYLSGSGHIRLVNPDNGKAVWISTTANDKGRAHLNTRAALRRAGYDPEEHDMPKGQRTTPIQVKQIVAMRRAGLPTEEIARRVGLSTAAVTDHSPAEYRPGGSMFRRTVSPQQAQAAIAAFDAGRNSIGEAVAVMEPPEPATSPANGYRVRGKTPPGKKLAPDQIEAMRTAVEAGKSNTAIAIEIGVSNWTVGQYRRKFAEARAVSESVDVAVAAAATSIADEVRQTMADYGHYPLITDLIRKQHRYQSMLGEAEKLGDEDLQIMLLSKLELTGLEKEIVAFWGQTHGDVANGTNGTGVHAEE